MNSREFDYLKDFMKQRSGIVLSTDKAYLAESRLAPVARDLGMANIEELIAALMKTQDEAFRVRVTDAMTTNDTFFFRDQTPFDCLRDDVLPRIVAARRARGKNQIRIWSAACSTGQEPYSIAMMLREEPEKFGGMSYEIVATDLSSQAIDKARTGLFTQFEVQRGLPIGLLVKYFAKNGTQWEIDPAIRDMIKFHAFNLLDSYGVLGRFDVVLCRNVLIYFDQETKSRIVSRIADVTAADGALYLGVAESVIGISEDFAPIAGRRGVYQLAAAPTAGATAGASRARA